MNSVNDAENDAEEQSQSNEPKQASDRACPSKPVALFKGLPAHEQVFSFGVHNRVFTIAQFMDYGPSESKWFFPAQPINYTSRRIEMPLPLDGFFARPQWFPR
jgi:hypothetical protein